MDERRRTERSRSDEYGNAGNNSSGYGRDEYDDRREGEVNREGYEDGYVDDYDEEAARRAASRRNRERRRTDQRVNNMLLGAVAVLLLVVLILLAITLIRGNGNDAAATTEAAQTESVAETSDDAAQTDTEAASEAVSDEVESAVDLDNVPPVISGVTSKTITVGDSISYMEGVTVTDNVDTDVEIEVDNSQVDLNTPGEYAVFYKATDSAGNFIQVEATITVLEKETAGASEDPAKLSELNSYSRQILKRILTDDMSDMEKLGRIYDWVRFECDYVDDSDKSSWVNAALSMIDTRKGDCFSYFAVAKALLENAGYETVDVVKSNTEHSRHYWSLVKIEDGWYHFDTTPRHGDGDYFCMVTDEQLENYSKEHEDSHIWDKTLYPSVSTKVITDMGAEDGNVPVYKLNY